MNHVQKYLAQANRQIAELTVQIARQRIIVKNALDTGQRSEMAESLLDALEGSLRIFEKHRIFLLSCNGSSRALPPSDAATAGACHDATGMERHDKDKSQQKNRTLDAPLQWWPSRLVATAAEDCLSTTIWSGGAAAGLYLGTGLILAFLVHTHYPGVLVM